MDAPRDLRLAVLIDADNISYANIKAMMEEIAKYGIPTFKRIYGDWTKPTLAGWKTVLLENAISPVQQYSYTVGKNSSDSALIIDAMDILYTGRVDGFCIISSDSDFTRLATRLREAGMQVIGIGEKKTPPAFISSCNKFIYLEILKEETKTGPTKTASVKTSPRSTAPTVSTIDRGLIKLIVDSINDIAEEDGWVFLGVLGNLILKKQPDFDPRNYGYKKLIDLIRHIPDFEIDRRATGRNNVFHIYIRARDVFPTDRKAPPKNTRR
jgi:uncharacterized LabA/DUF88 family protein